MYFLASFWDRFLMDFGSQNRLKINQKSIKNRIKNKVTFFIDFWSIFAWILKLCWKRRRPNSLKKQRFFNDFGFLAYDKNDFKKLSKRVEKSLKNHWKLVQKSIRKAFKKLMDFWIDFWSIFGPIWEPKSLPNRMKVDQKSIPKHSRKKYEKKEPRLDAGGLGSAALRNSQTHFPRGPGATNPASQGPQGPEGQLASLSEGQLARGQEGKRASLKD